MFVKLKHVRSFHRKGRRYWYHRITKERLPDEVNARVQRVLAINAGLEKDSGSRPLTGTFAAVIAHYKDSAEYSQKRPQTLRSYNNYLDKLQIGFHDVPLQTVDRAWLYELRNSFKETPRTANGYIQMMSILIEHARNYMPEAWPRHGANPAHKFKKLKTGHYVAWPDEWINTFRLDAPERMRWSFELAYYTGQRNGDVLQMQWHHIKGNRIEVAQEKTEERLQIPIHPNLQKVLEEIPRTLQNGITPMNIIYTERGNAYTQDGWRTLWDRSKKKIGLPKELVFHGLRRNATARLAAAGCSNSQIKAITGHKTDKMVDEYSKEARRKLMADDAMGKLLALHPGN